MNRNLVYDVGFHNGDDSAYYLHCGYQVVAVEANPLLVEAGRQRFDAQIKSGQLKLLHCGISDQPGIADFWVHEAHSEWSSFMREFGCRDGGPCHAVPVECVPFRHILDAHGVPFYLKVDIEGHDEQCIENLDPEDLPEYVSVEFGPLEHIDRLAALGYDAFKIVNQKNHNDPVTQSRSFDRVDQRLKRQLRKLLVKRKPVGAQSDGSWIFPHGSSGPIGEEIAGSWLERDEAHSLMHSHHTGQRRLQRGWFDLHAKRAS